MTEYRCWFNFKGSIAVVTSEEGVGAFKDGFWITGTLQLTKGADCQFWIPPSQLVMIEKGGQ